MLNVLRQATRGLSTGAARAPRWDVSSTNNQLLNASYAVRGPVLDLAMKLENKLKAGDHLPFSELIYCNIGNPQSLKQQPVTFLRQVLAMVLNPSLIDLSPGLFPADAVERARMYLKDQPMGAYSNSQGIASVRKEVANFIQERDGFPADPDNIFLTNGASEGVRNVMVALMRGKSDGFNDGVLVPIPQYPLYSALTTLLNGNLVPYYLTEEDGWALTVNELKAQLQRARDQGVTVRGLVVINPGNPTGQLLPRDNIEGIIKLCAEENLVMMADEVYQTNIYRDGASFTSFRKVAGEMGFDPQGGDLQLISFHSISKGFLGECGLRGGYYELFGIDANVKAQLYKLASISLCSNTIGQIATGLMVNPPKPGSPSFPKYNEEKEAILSSLKRRALKLTAGLSALEGVSVQPSDGAMYAFPKMTLPSAFVEEAKKAGTVADQLYCLKLVENTGIVVVPGSGFGQKDGTWHFRTTFLPSEGDIDSVISRLQTYHAAFMDKYRA